MIDTTFDFRNETQRDPDGYSPTLRRYHRMLWSKPLPNGAIFALEEAGSKGRYFLRHTSDLGVFKLSSDTITNRLLRDAKKAIGEIPEKVLPPYRGYTIGSALLFPKNRQNGRMTINGARGTKKEIKDRFDLTLECIRRHYLGEESPLADTLAAYADFFALFDDFAGYVDFWLLGDLVQDDQVDFWMPFDNFKSPAVPQTLDSYLAYYQAREDFITARNARMDAYVRALPPTD